MQSGPCISPASGSTGRCSGGDCNTSYKYDCWGYEKCAISKCGRWSAASTAIISRTADFQCFYEPGGSVCQTRTGFMEGPDAAENAERFAIAYTH